jgi:adenylate cyclase
MDEQPFVARDKELQSLQARFSTVLTGRGQVCLVDGEAGSGKTALAVEFVRRMQEQQHDVLAAFGQSDALTGLGDPYLPFREIVQTLTGTGEGKHQHGRIDQKNAERAARLGVKAVELLVEHGPDLINLLVPGSAIFAKIGMGVVKGAGLTEKLKKLVDKPANPLDAQGGVKQEHVFEQCATFIKALAEKHPLLLVVDDLQWTDPSSMELFFYLSRRIHDSRILLLGLYRPVEVALGRNGERHPLEKVLSELKRYYGDIVLDLDSISEEERQEFVQRFLGTEANKLDAGFVQALYAHTCGHALFTVELLRDMQERGLLVKDVDGRWITTPGLVWDNLPARVEGVIEERLNRLEEQQIRLLSIASVEGETFTTEVLAKVDNAALLDLVRQLGSELEKRHHLVASAGMERLASTRLTFFRFAHNLFCSYLYRSMGEVEKVHLHEAVGNALEELYGPQAEQIAQQLAVHFSLAGIDEKAVHYLFTAGKRAFAACANTEALEYYQKALECTQESDHARRSEILLACDEVFSISGKRDLQLQNLERLKLMADLKDDDTLRATIALRMARYYVLKDKIQDSMDQSLLGLEIALRIDDKEKISWAYSQLGFSYVRLGDFERSLEYSSKGLDLARQIHYEKGEANNLLARGEALVFSGKEGALEHLMLALGIAQKMGNRILESSIRSNLAKYYLDHSEFSKAVEERLKDIQIFQQYGDREGVINSLGNLGPIYAGMGNFARARQVLEEALKGDLELDGNPVYVQINLSTVCFDTNDFEAGIEYARQALESAGKSLFLQGYIQTCMGENLLGQGKLGEAREAFQKAYDIRCNREPAALAMESLAGLVRVDLAERKLPEALEKAEKILNYRKVGSFEAAENASRILLACYQVLRACEDSRAGNVLYDLYKAVLEKANKIVDEETRMSFLELVPTNNTVIQEWNLLNK